MKRELERAREETSGFNVYLLAGYYFVTGNYSLLVVLSGLGFILFGATALSGRPEAVFGIDQLSWMQHGVFAGMFGVWGASLIVIGVSAYAVLWANKMYARFTSDAGSEEESDSESEPEFDANSL